MYVFPTQPLQFWCVVLQKCTRQILKHFGCWWNPAGFMPFSEVIAVVYRGDNHMGLGFYLKNKSQHVSFAFDHVLKHQICFWSLKAVSQTEAPLVIAGLSPLEHFPWRSVTIHEAKRLKKKNMQCDTLVKPEFRIVPSMIYSLQGCIWVLTPRVFLSMSSPRRSDGNLGEALQRQTLWGNVEVWKCWCVLKSLGVYKPKIFP